MESIGGEKGEEDDKFDEMCGIKRHDERMPRRLSAFAPRSMERAMERISATRSSIAEAAEVSRAKSRSAFDSVLLLEDDNDVAGDVRSCCCCGRWLSFMKTLAVVDVDAGCCY